MSGNRKNFRALPLRQGPARALFPCPCSVNPPARCFRSVPLFQNTAEQAKRNRGFRGGAGFGNDINGKIPPFKQLHEFRGSVCGEGVPGKEDPGRPFSQKIVMGRAQQLDRAAGAQIGNPDNRSRPRPRNRTESARQLL
jgi:hypothetical protein